MCNLAHSSSALLGFALVDYPFQISVSMSSSSSSPVSHLYDQDIYFCSSADSIPGLSFTYFLHIDILHTTTIVFVQSNKQLWPQYVILLGIALLCNLIGCLFCRLSNISYLLSVDGIPWKVGAKICGFPLFKLSHNLISCPLSPNRSPSFAIRPYFIYLFILIMPQAKQCL